MDTTAEQHKQVDEAIEALRVVLADVRGRCGRDFIRQRPDGFMLDAIDAGRSAPADTDLLILCDRAGVTTEGPSIDADKTGSRFRELIGGSAPRMRYVDFPGMPAIDQMQLYAKQDIDETYRVQAVFSDRVIDAVAAIRKRWAGAEGSLSPTVTANEWDTCLEYRGDKGKWTLATIHDSDVGGDGEVWIDRFVNAHKDVAILLQIADSLAEQSVLTDKIVRETLESKKIEFRVGDPLSAFPDEATYTPPEDPTKAPRGKWMDSDTGYSTLCLKGRPDTVIASVNALYGDTTGRGWRAGIERGPHGGAEGKRMSEISLYISGVEYVLAEEEKEVDPSPKPTNAKIPKELTYQERKALVMERAKELFPKFAWEQLDGHLVRVLFAQRRLGLWVEIGWSDRLNIRVQGMRLHWRAAASTNGVALMIARCDEYLNRKKHKGRALLEETRKAVSALRKALAEGIYNG